MKPSLKSNGLGLFRGAHARCGNRRAARHSIKFAAACGVLAAFCAKGWACINFQFTPRMLVEESGLVVVATVEQGVAGQNWRLGHYNLLRGQSRGDAVVTIEKCEEEHKGDVAKLLTGNQGQPIIIFAGADSMPNEAKAYAHVGGTWLAVAWSGAKKEWQVKGFDPGTSGIFVGGTDMLIRMTEYLLKDPDADVPVSAGVRWMGDKIRIGMASGPPSGLTGIQIGIPGKWHVFSGSSSGDRLFLAQCAKGEVTFKDVTTLSGLDTKSRCFAWTDLNDDDIVDLVTCDGQILSVRFGKPDGTFQSGGKDCAIPMKDGCVGLLPYGMNGAWGVLVSTRGAPEILLVNAQTTGWRRVVLPAAAAGGSGGVTPCVTADFNGDGYADILKPGVRGGTLWKGSADGYAKPVSNAVSAGEGPAKCVLGDFNQDGAMDIFVAGRFRNTLWENDGRGNFKDVYLFAGSLSYKCPANAADVQTMDLNHDGRPDICLVYDQGDIQYHFNRGFRSFNEEGEVRLPGLLHEPGQPEIGQVALGVGDFNEDSSLDLVLQTAHNELYCFLNDMYERPGLRLRLPKG